MKRYDGGQFTLGKETRRMTCAAKSWMKFDRLMTHCSTETERVCPQLRLPYVELAISAWLGLTAQRWNLMLMLLHTSTPHIHCYPVQAVTSMQIYVGQVYEISQLPVSCWQNVQDCSLIIRTLLHTWPTHNLLITAWAQREDETLWVTLRHTFWSARNWKAQTLYTEHALCWYAELI